MKNLGNILFTFVLMGLVVFVYLNIDTISDKINEFLVSQKDIIIKDSNIYTRDYDYISFNYDEDYIPLSNEDFKNIYFNILNNGWDDFTFYCPKEYESCMDDIQVFANDKIVLSDINSYVNPYNSFSSIDTTVSSNREINVKVNKKYSDEKIMTINNKVLEILNSLNLEGLSDIDKIKAVHDYIINNTSYDKEGANGNDTPYDSTSAYGTLIENFSVCSGYSDAMAIFLDILKIPNLKITSDNHIWNLVMVDGKYLHLDLTWDDVDNPKYKNNYFLIDTNQLLSLDNKEHNFNRDFFLEAK